MNGNDLLAIGYKPGHVVGYALKAAKKASKDGASEEQILTDLAAVLADPVSFTEHTLYGDVAKELAKKIATPPPPSYTLEDSAPYKVWGQMDIEPGAMEQMKRAVRLPIAVRGALMPDAHQGYGLPIGGVLATHNSVIPYAVGVDIACRMKMTVYNVSPHVLEQKKEKFRKALEANTAFGAGAHWNPPVEHPVMDDPLWREHPLARRMKDTAHNQLGTSGSGNHFVEFGTLNITEPIPTEAGIMPPGTYLALLSHSGSRRFGMEVADYFTEVAMQKHNKLPKDFIHLSWLDINEGAGAEYWELMNLAGRYASANHAVIHRMISDDLRLDILGGVENHHNFCWKEQLEDGTDVFVHRKGATPAGAGVYGVIPGSMQHPGFVVRGKGNMDAINSASHGAGRRMSRGEAFKRFEWDVVKRELKKHGVELLSAGLDESPGAYKDIRRVMEFQSDLVDVVAEFQPRMVKMAPSDGKRNYGGERD
jgi:tRNA-splicing ligase RtcB (3'-phosphate/5'-hydroxy nucleic acid ligase)